MKEKRSRYSSPSSQPLLMMWRSGLLAARREETASALCCGRCVQNVTVLPPMPRYRRKHSRFRRRFGYRPQVTTALSTGGCGEHRSSRREGLARAMDGRRRRPPLTASQGSVSGLESRGDEGHEILELRVVTVLELPLDLVHGVDDSGVMAAAELGADLR